MSDKIIVCRCEDVTRADVEAAVARGYTDLEEIKRYTGFGTGPCQGKECLAQVAGELARACAAPRLVPFTARPPLAPTALRLLARDRAAHRYDDDRADAPTVEAHVAPEPAPAPRVEVPTVRDVPALPARVELAIVGAGVMGLSIAYHLARRGLTDVLVLDRGYLAEGASGRNGGGVRAQWSSELNIRLMQRSVELCRAFAVELGVNVWFRQGGYLFLARNAAEVARFARNAEVQNRFGVRTRIIDAAEAKALVPVLEQRHIAAAAYNPDDGIVFPWPFLWGYARRAAELGVTIATHTPVVGLGRDGAGFAITTPRGTVHARRVVNACGAWSPAIAAMLDVHMPTWPVRHEICSSEPLKPFLGPMVSEPGTGLYFSQSMRGEIVGGISAPGHGASSSIASSLEFLATYARRITRVAPALGDVKVLRQWAGPYDESPDGSPLLGAPAAQPDFFVAGGFVGRGFMMAPVIGELYGEWLTGGAPHEVFRRWHVDRFAAGETRREEDFDIG